MKNEVYLIKSRYCHFCDLLHLSLSLIFLLLSGMLILAAEALLFFSCYLYTFHALTECFWRCAFISILFSAISRSGIPAVLPLAEEGGDDFLQCCSIPLCLSFLSVLPLFSLFIFPLFVPFLPLRSSE